MDQEAITPEEWEALLFAPMWVALGVAGIDERVERAEIGALAAVIDAADRVRSGLLRQVLAELAGRPEVVDRFTRDPLAVGEGLRRVSRILDARVPADEAAGFREGLVGIGIRVGAASGKQSPGDVANVSREELAGLAFVAEALDYDLAGRLREE